MCDGLSTKSLKIIWDGGKLKPTVYKRQYKNPVLVFFSLYGLELQIVTVQFSVGLGSCLCWGKPTAPFFVNSNQNIPVKMH